jgi:hypothetical protein
LPALRRRQVVLKSFHMPTGTFFSPPRIFPTA